MPSLRDYRDRIVSVKSTRKITSAMKMVAASKLRKAQDQAEAAQPYARSMAAMMTRVAGNISINESSPRLLAGTGSDQRHLIVVVTADRGLCAGFNANIVKMARQLATRLKGEGKDVFFVCAGRKGGDLLRREYGSNIWQRFTGIIGKSKVEYAESDKVAQFILDKFEAGEFDVCTMVYNQFKSVLTQTPTAQQLIPFKMPEDENKKEKEKTATGAVSVYDFEPDEQEILKALLPKNIGVQIYRALLDSSAGEQAARMTAMDNATRNAGDMIKGLSLRYNRARQAHITKELIEIISGAEAI
ncbi:MAG TPA: F0F1 ATP synthase subunit gamma [Rhodospirillaceae bacterium]|nr:F0F1 ATP synthase subunit gamma [Rhodospirillaceae bacterium]